MSGDLNSAAVLVTRLLRLERLVAAHHQGSDVTEHGTTCTTCTADGYWIEEAAIHWRPLSVGRRDV